MSKIRAGIIGATGYTGVELIRLLAAHPQVELNILVSETYHDMQVAQVFPHLAQVVVHTFESLNLAQVAAKCDVVFLALPHTKAAAMAAELLTAGCRVIDLSADLRLNEGEVYEKWYQHTAAAESLL